MFCPQRRLACSLALFGFALLGALCVQAEPVAFGSRTLEIPPPEGFVAANSPQLKSVLESYLPSSNRLVEIYVTPEVKARLERGETEDLGRYFMIQSLRQLDGRPLSAAEFAEAQPTIEGAMRKALEDSQSKIDAQARTGNAAVKQVSGVDPGLSISDIGYHGSYRKEPWGLFVSMTAKVKTVGEADEAMNSAVGVTLIDHQLMNIMGYSNAASAGGMEWAKTAVSRWADAIRAANPDQAALEREAKPLGKTSESTAYRFGRILGIGLFVGLLFYFFRRR